MATKERIIELASAHLAGTNLFVTGVKINADNHITVQIDGDDGVKITDCVGLSRVLEAALDSSGEGFALDVTSHGATSPLVQPRQYKKNVGRILEIKLTNGERAEGELKNCDEEGFVIGFEVRENKALGKGKVTAKKELRINYKDIHEARVKLKF